MLWATHDSRLCGGSPSSSLQTSKYGLLNSSECSSRCWPSTTNVCFRVRTVSASISRYSEHDAILSAESLSNCWYSQPGPVEALDLVRDLFLAERKQLPFVDEPCAQIARQRADPGIRGTDNENVGDGCARLSVRPRTDNASVSASRSIAGMITSSRTALACSGFRLAGGLTSR